MTAEEKFERRRKVKIYSITAGISLVVGFGIFALLAWAIQIAYMDAFAFAGLILLTIGFFAFATKEGFFDFATYGFKQFGSMLFSKKPNQHNGYADYLAEKKEKRKNSSNYSVVIMLVGIAYLLGMFIFYIIS